MLLSQKKAAANHRIGFVQTATITTESLFCSAPSIRELRGPFDVRVAAQQSMLLGKARLAAPGRERAMTDYPAHTEADLMTGLGTIVTRWTYIDHLMGEFLSFLVEGKPALMYVITNNVSARTISEWIRTLLPLRFEESALGELTELLTKIDDLRRERNALVHGLWSPHTPGSAEVQTIRWERREVIKVEFVTIGDLKELAGDIDEAIKALASLGQRYGFPIMPEQT